jgi:hypothetical protein
MAIETLSHRIHPSTSSSVPQSNNTARAPPISTASNSTTTAPTPLIRTKVRSAIAIRREQNRVKNVALNAQLRQVRNKFDEAVLDLGKKYQKSPGELRSRALLKNKFSITKRKVNAWNAYRRMQSKSRSTYLSVWVSISCLTHRLSTRGSWRLFKF